MEERPPDARPSPFRLTADGYLRPVLTLLSGAAVAQVVAYGAKPILTRLFTPEAFGVLGVFTAAVVVLSSVSSGKYEDAIVLPERDREAAHITVLATLLAMAAALGLLLLAPWRGAVAAWADVPAYDLWVLLLPAGLLAYRIGIIAEQWLVRTQRYRGIASSRLLLSVTTLGVQLGAGILGFAAGGLLAGVLSGWLAAAVLLTILVLTDSEQPFSRVTRQHLATVARRYRRFPQFGVPAALLNTASRHLPAFLLLGFFDPAAVGHYVLAVAAISVPIGLLAQSYAQVYVTRATQAPSTEALADATRPMLRQLALLGWFPVAALVLAGPQLFVFVFGSDWEAAGQFARFLAPWQLFVLLGSPLTRLFDVFERQREELIYSGLLLGARTAALLTGGILGSVLVSVASFGLASALAYALLARYLLRWAGLGTRTLLRVLVRPLLLSAAPLALLAGTLWLAPTPVLTTLAAAAGAGLYYALAFRGGLPARP